MTIIRSVWAATGFVDQYHQIDQKRWADGGLLELSNAKVFFKNDHKYLYILLDVINDTVADKTGDYFWITVDVNRSKNIDPYMGAPAAPAHVYARAGADINFSFMGPPLDKFVKQYYLGPCRWTKVFDTYSSCITQFRGSFNNKKEHRIWVFRIYLDEIGVDPTTWWGSANRPTIVRMGLRIASRTPQFVDEIPANFCSNFANLTEVSLATRPDFPPQETGPIFFGVGLIPYRRIDQNNGHATTEDDARLVIKNGAFGDCIDVFGDISRLWNAGVRSYKIKYSKDGGAEQDLRQSWTNYKREIVVGEWEEVLYTIGPNAEGIYDLPDPSEDWWLQDLLLRWQTQGFGGGNGLYTLRLELFSESGAEVAMNAVPAEDQLLKLAIDNTAPTVDINKMQHGDEFVGRCAIISQGDTGFRFQITVNDAEGHLQAFSLTARHGEPHDVAETIPDSIQTYDELVHGPSWNGVSEHWVPRNSSYWRASESCAHEIRLVADARITNGYGPIFQDVECSKYVTILVH